MTRIYHQLYAIVPKTLDPYPIAAHSFFTCSEALMRATDRFIPGMRGFHSDSGAATAPRRHSRTTPVDPPACLLLLRELRLRCLSQTSSGPGGLRTNASMTRVVGEAPHAKRHCSILILKGRRIARSRAVSLASDSSAISRAHEVIHSGRNILARTASAPQATAICPERPEHAMDGPVGGLHITDTREMYL